MDILNDRKYRQDFTGDIQGKGMSVEYGGSLAMDHVRNAENIKSDVSLKCYAQSTFVYFYATYYVCLVF